MKRKSYLFLFFIGIAIFENKFIRSLLKNEMTLKKGSTLSTNLRKTFNTMTSKMAKYNFSHIGNITAKDKSKSPKERILNDVKPYRKHNYDYQNALYSKKK